MSQKSSVPQAIGFVSQALKRDIRNQTQYLTGPVAYFRALFRPPDSVCLI